LADRDDDQVAALLKLAGPRSPIPTERLARIRSAAHTAWRRAVRRRRLTAMAAGGIGLLAAAAALVWALEVGQAPLPLQGPAPLATVVRVTGDLRARLAPGQTLAAGAALSTASGRAALRWHDGTSLRLDEGTRLRLESATTVALDAGAVYVDTGREAPTAAEITIATRLGSARPLGTRYEVRWQGSRLRVRVRHGSVDLEGAGRTDRATAGEELVAAVGGEVARRHVAPYDADWGWVTAAAPSFPLEGASARALLEWAAAEGGWTLEPADAELAASLSRIVLHGSVEGFTPEDALKAVLPTCGLSHRLEGGRLLVRRAAGSTP
jgi:ferric-dicitrate binding protein FerR (iron transport regulator)